MVIWLSRRFFTFILMIIIVLGLGMLGLFPGKGEYLIKKSPGPTAIPKDNLANILKKKGIPRKLSKPLLYVTKSKLTLTLYEGGLPLKTYMIAMGENNLAGTKLQEGDSRTPEGRYYISDKRIIFLADSFLGSRWLGISYPKKEDVERGYEASLITENQYLDLIRMAEQGKMLPQKTRLGGELGVHGGHKFGKESTWTLGCIALTNRDIEELYRYIPVGTPIIIRP